MNAVRMQDGQVAVPILSADDFAAHRKLGHAIEFTACFPGNNYQQPSHEKPGSGGWVFHGPEFSDKYYGGLRYRAVLPDYPPAKPKGFWARLVALFA